MTLPTSAYPKHVLVAFGGTLTEQSGQDEIWQCGIRCIGPAAGWLDPADVDAYLASIKTPMSTWFALAANLMSNSSRLTFIKANNISADGSYAEPLTHRTDYSPGIVGGAAPQVPAFLSVCFTWTTSVARGLAARGRIYPPNFGAGVALGGSTVGSTAIAGSLTAAKSLLGVVANTAALASIRLTPAVVSKGSTTLPGPVFTPGVARPINGVRIGNVFDYQSRRKNGVPEAYSASTYP